MAFVPGLESFILLAINIVREIMNGLERLKASTFPHSEFLCLSCWAKNTMYWEYVFGVIFCYVAFALVVHVPDFWGLKQASHCH